MNSASVIVAEDGGLRSWLRVLLFYLCFSILIFATPLVVAGIVQGRWPTAESMRLCGMICLGPLPMFRSFHGADLAMEFVLYGIGGSALWGIAVLILGILLRTPGRTTIALRQWAYAFTLWWLGFGLFRVSLSV